MERGGGGGENLKEDEEEEEVDCDIFVGNLILMQVCWFTNKSSVCLFTSNEEIILK